MKKLYQEDLWNKILEEVELFSNDKTMEYYFKTNILNFNNLSEALSFSAIAFLQRFSGIAGT